MADGLPGSVQREVRKVRDLQGVAEPARREGAIESIPRRTSMSRNIGSTICAVCRGPVVLDEPARPILASDCGRVADEYVGKLIVARAHCDVCVALYLAWVNRDPYGRRHLDLVEDLSFLHSFDDHPHAADLPPLEKLREIHRRDYLAGAAMAREEAASLIEEAQDMESRAGGPSYWESYLDRGAPPEGTR